MKEFVTLENSQSVLPFALGTKHNGVVYLSGMVSKNMLTDEPIPGSIEEETRQTLENIKLLLERAGSSFDKILKATVFLVDMNDFAAMNKVYKEFFDSPEKLASRSTVGTPLVGAFKVEIEVIAAL